MKKIDYFISNYNKLSEILICPFCSEKLNFCNNSLKCINNHTFNISKKGTTILYKTSTLTTKKHNEIAIIKYITKIYLLIGETLSITNFMTNYTIKYVTLFKTEKIKIF